MDRQPRFSRLALLLAVLSSGALLGAWALGHRIGVVETLAGLAVAAVIWSVETRRRPLRAPVVEPLSRSNFGVVVIDAPKAGGAVSRSDVA